MEQINRPRNDGLSCSLTLSYTISPKLQPSLTFYGKVQIYTSGAHIMISLWALFVRISLGYEV